MITKNLEKLAEIGERKLFDELNKSLIEIKESLMYIRRNGRPNDLPNQSLKEKRILYNRLITACKNYGLNVNKQEEIYAQINSEKW